jgi:hypothetical protein
MLTINTRIIFGAAYLVMVVGMPNPASASVHQLILSSETVSINSNIFPSKNPNLVADSTIYWGAKQDFKISMPGVITQNTSDQLTSTSDYYQAVYTIINQDFPEASRIPIPQIRQVLKSSMRETIGSTGKIVRTTDLVIDKYPGLELIIQHPDGSTGQYRSFVVNQRLYFMGARTQGELTTEAVNFFDSFRVYPQKINYSNRRVY